MIAGDAPVADVEEGAAGQRVLLAVRGRQAGVVGQVFAVHGVFGGHAGAADVGQHHHVAQLFAVAAVHARQELRERGLAGFAAALVDVVGHVVGDQGQHRVPVAAVEGGVVGQHQFDGAVGRAVAVDDHEVLGGSCQGRAARSTLPPDRISPTRRPAKCPG